MKMKLLALLSAASLSTAAAGELRIGIVGCDTSHVIAFTEVLNNPAARNHIAGGKVVAAFKGGSADLPASASRVDGYAETLREKYGVTFYDSVAQLCTNVDAVLIESVDGRTHLPDFKSVLAARKPVFIDKPMAASLADVVEIFRLAQEANLPVFSSSSLRYGKNTQAVRAGQIGRVHRAELSSPSDVGPFHPELFWYGIHGVEALFAVMGPGCETVQRQITTNGLIEVTGVWRDGRIGIFRENRDKKYFGTATGENGTAPVGSFDGYVPLLAEIMKFFQTGQAPVRPEETIELFAFMQAAEQSKAGNGAVIKIADVLKAAGAPKADQR